MSDHFSKEDMDYEIKFYEGLLKKEPEFTEALAALGDLYTKRGFHKKGLKVDERLALLKPSDPIVLYNLACSYSLLNYLDKALITIKKAIACGYRDFRHLEKDADLLNLRNDRRFKRYLGKVGPQPQPGQSK